MKHFMVNINRKILCKECGHSHLSYNPFITLKLELTSDNILSCLKSHLSWEEDIVFTCDKCKCKDNAKKRLTLTKNSGYFSYNY